MAQNNDAMSAKRSVLPIKDLNSLGCCPVGTLRHFAAPQNLERYRTNNGQRAAGQAE